MPNFIGLTHLYFMENTMETLTDKEFNLTKGLYNANKIITIYSGLSTCHIIK